MQHTEKRSLEPREGGGPFVHRDGASGRPKLCVYAVLGDTRHAVVHAKRQL